MKNSIHNSLSGILPDESQKQRIYENIICPKKKIGGYKVLNAIFVTVCCFMFFITFKVDINESVTPVMPRSVSDEVNYINYKDTCYYSVSSYYDIGEQIDSVYILGKEYKAYVNKLGGIVINNDGVYEVYLECEENL